MKRIFYFIRYIIITIKKVIVSCKIGKIKAKFPTKRRGLPRKPPWRGVRGFAPTFSLFRHAEGVEGIGKNRVIARLKYFCSGIDVGMPK